MNPFATMWSWLRTWASGGAARVDRFSIQPHHLPPDARAPSAGERAQDEAAPLTAQWRNARSDALGAPIPLGPVTSTHLEYPAIGGRMVRSDVEEPVAFASAPPRGATHLMLARGAMEVGQLPLNLLQRAPSQGPPPQKQRIGPANAAFVVPVFAERFTDKNDFMAHVQGLYDWVRTQPPFNRPAVAARLAFDAYFWRSDPTNGRFHTDDSKCDSEGRLFYGDRDLARQLLQPFIGASTVSLILINSGLRGGAGGQPGYSAWTSITSAPGEHWEAVCLHEVGHGLGLADEYCDPARAGEWPAVMEPNVSADPRPSATPWGGLATLPDNPAPSFGLGAGGGSPASTVGTFQGARYRTDLYRGAWTCLMLDTTQHFCPVCQDHIVATL